jgi:hypothetical protein
MLLSFYALRTSALLASLSTFLTPTVVWAESLADLQARCLTRTDGGVLISGQAKDFPCYLNLILTENMPYVILVAVLLVVVSGIQYMLAAGNAADQGKAKQRIVGTLIGIIFYTLIRYLIPLISGGLGA